MKNRMAPGYQRDQGAPSVVSRALAECSRGLWGVALFSSVVNLLMLAGPLYMLQVYDRVLASRSIPTLVVLTIFLVMAYGFQGLLDLVRSRIIVRGAMVFDRRLATTAHAAVLAIARQNPRAGDAAQPIRDLDQIRAFMTGSGPVAIVDIPWMPVFLAGCFLIHPWLGFLALGGGCVLATMTILTERAVRDPTLALARDQGVRLALTEACRRNVETVSALGMGGRLNARWAALNEKYLETLARSSDVVNAYGSISKVLRIFLQSAALGLGAYLVIQNQLTAGGMIASSIVMARALAPIEGAIANWKSFTAARQSFRRLSELFQRMPDESGRTELPKPVSRLDVEDLTVAVPGTQTVLLRDIRFSLAAGEALGVIGPNASGKTSLMRALIGVWPAVRGAVRLDGAALDQWDPEALGVHIGYVAQTVDLFDGTIADNIARMPSSPDSESVLAAARAAGAHEMILALTDGYDTRVGEGGVALSAGQKQRIALARALYGDPFIIALDEPHANLDVDGEAALNVALRNAKRRGAIVVLIAHRPSALAICDKVLVLAAGRQQAFGPRDQVLASLTGRAPQPAPAPAMPLRAVAEKE